MGRAESVLGSSVTAASRSSPSSYSYAYLCAAQCLARFTADPSAFVSAAT